MLTLRRSIVQSLPVLILLLAAACRGGGGGGLGPDKVPPVFGGVTAATAVDDTIIILQWTAAMDDRVPASSIAYNVYVAISPGGQNFLTPDATTSRGSLQFSVAGLLPSTTYFFVVRAMDTAGNEETNTVERSATTLTFPDTMAPIFGGVSGAVATSESSIDISWLPAMDDNTPPSLITYKAYLAFLPGNQNFTLPRATSLPGDTSVVAGGLVAGTTYFIVVRAVDAAGNEDTNTVEVSEMTFTPDTTPPTFAGLQTAVTQNPTRVNLAWSAASDDRAMPSEIVYRVYWATTPGGQNFSSANATTSPGALTYLAASLNPGTDYYFVVRARDPAGNEETNMREVRATTLVSFGGQVLTIFVTNCAFSNCHGNVNPMFGMELTNYGSFINTVININAQEPAGIIDRIEPGDSARSYLQHKIDGTQGSVGGGGVQMPKIAPALPLATRDIIRTWINQGALDN